MPHVRNPKAFSGWASCGFGHPRPVLGAQAARRAGLAWGVRAAALSCRCLAAFNGKYDPLPGTLPLGGAKPARPACVTGGGPGPRLRSPGSLWVPGLAGCFGRGSHSLTGSSSRRSVSPNWPIDGFSQAFQRWGSQYNLS